MSNSTKVNIIKSNIFIKHFFRWDKFPVRVNKIKLVRLNSLWPDKKIKRPVYSAVGHFTR